MKKYVPEWLLTIFILENSLTGEMEKQRSIYYFVQHVTKYFVLTFRMSDKLLLLGFIFKILHHTPANFMQLSKVSQAESSFSKQLC